MAVKVHEFFSNYYQKTAFKIFLLQAIGGVAAGIFVWVFLQNQLIEPSISFIFGLLCVVIANTIITSVALKTLSDPLKVITQAIAHVSDDPVVTQPPDISSPRYERSGVKAIIQTVYELAVAANSTNNTASAPVNTGDFFKSLLDRLPCGVIALDTQGKITYANDTAPIKPTPDGQHNITLIFEQNDNLQKWLDDCRVNKVRDTHTWLRVADQVPGDDNRRIFDVFARYQKNDTSGIETVIVTFDRTSVYAADQNDMDFIALAAHELRGPITIIRGYLDVLNEEIGPKLDADQQVLLDRLQVSAERLSGYVNNILNVSRYDRNQFALHLQEESLGNIFNSLVPDLTLRAHTQRRELTFNIPPDLPTVAADSSSISEVIVNLIDNAIKYSRDGGQITTSAATKGNFVEVTVQDRGIGMPDSVVGNLFNKFYRSHRTRQGVGGTGLGLYICKAIVEGHGGEIWVRSTEGVGTTFGFTLPIYSTVAQNLAGGNNKDIIQRSEGWIKNHAMYRR